MSKGIIILLVSLLTHSIPVYQAQSCTWAHCELFIYEVYMARNQVRKKKGKEWFGKNDRAWRKQQLTFPKTVCFKTLVKLLCHQGWQRPQIVSNFQSCFSLTMEHAGMKHTPLQACLAKWDNCSALLTPLLFFCWFQGLMVAILYCFINNEVRETLGVVPICLISIHCRKRKLKMVLNC